MATPSSGLALPLFPFQLLSPQEEIVRRRPETCQRCAKRSSRLEPNRSLSTYLLHGYFFHQLLPHNNNYDCRGTYCRAPLLTLNDFPLPLFSPPPRSLGFPLFSSSSLFPKSCARLEPTVDGFLCMSDFHFSAPPSFGEVRRVFSYTVDSKFWIALRRRR